ncbi:VOC family protein [Roseofilum sp. Guam]|uniref:VOC family protein n=1 Tax=Roseofilum sp. Guam TaxID=2821502 RepID=UPI001B202971|nr:VOC family protein [Roseofilum sp. Guam]MBP0027571.1 VOC family protein [Roseofilum sp. Guam]
MKIIQSLHTAILVSDLDKAEHFYSSVLGLTKIDRQLKFPGIWYQIGHYQLHLMMHPDVEITRWNPEKWGRNAHIAFEIDSLEEVKQQLIAYGCNFKLSSSGRSALFTQDPDGNILELQQISRSSWDGEIER